MRGKRQISSIFLSINTLGYCFALLLLGEGLCRIFSNINFQGTDRNLFVENVYGTSRGNAKNVETISFGIKVYTDENGFRTEKTNIFCRVIMNQLF